MTAPSEDLIDQLLEAATQVRTLLRQSHEALRDKFIRIHEQFDEKFRQAQAEAFPLLQETLTELTVSARDEYCDRLNHLGEEAERLVRGMDELLKVKREETTVTLKVSELPDDLQRKLTQHLRHMKMLAIPGGRAGR